MTPRRNHRDRYPVALVLGNDPKLAADLELLLPQVQVRWAWSAPDTEGRDADIVVVAGDFPLQELDDVFVHPRLSGLPVVLVAPGRQIDANAAAAQDLWLVVDTDHIPERTAAAMLELLVEQAELPGAGVASLGPARAHQHHPSVRSMAPAASESLPAASS